MSYEVLDSKLKYLIQICKETGNYKKISVTYFILLSNSINEIGLRLGLDHRNIKKNEKIYEYMERINQIFMHNLKARIFKKVTINEIRRVENLFIRNKGKIPRDDLKILLEIYYDLRKLEVPNFYEMVKKDQLLNTPGLNAFSFLFQGKKSNDGKSNTIKELIKQKIDQEDLALQEDLRTSYSKNQLLKKFYLKQISNALNNHKNHKIILQGSLKDNIIYRQSEKEMIKYFIIGLFICSLSMGIIFLLEMNYFPNAVSILSSYLLITIVLAFFLFVIYHYHFKKRRWM